MKNATLKSKIFSFIIVLTMLVGMIPYSGIIAFAVGSSTAPFETAATAELDEEMTLAIPFREDGNAYVDFTPAVSGTYIIKATVSESDPILELFDSEGTFLNRNDDYNDRLFRLEADLEAGKTYYLGLADYIGDSECTFVIEKMCDEHIPSETVNCLGTLCDACDIYFGGQNDNHDLSDIQTCLGYYCSVCEEYVGEANEDNHFDNDLDFFCDTCGISYTDVYEEATGYINTNVEIPVSEFILIRLTVAKAGTYHFYSNLTSGDPMATVYNSNMDYIVGNDDYIEGLDFFMERDLEPGIYYVKIAAIGSGNFVGNIVAYPVCDEHIPTDVQNCLGTVCESCGQYFGDMKEHNFSEEQTCLGYYCDICEEYIGEGSEEGHDLSGEQSCIGYYCDICEEYIGEGSEEGHDLSEEQTCLGYYCYICYEYVGEGSEEGHDLSEEQTCLGYYCYICYEYVGEGSEEGHNLSEEQTCLGYYCFVCEEYVGEANDELHNLSEDRICAGYYCYDCQEYFGEPTEHNDDDEDGICDSCYFFVGVTRDGFGENDSLSFELETGEYYAFKFIPVESKVYLIRSNSNADPYLKVYNDIMNQIAQDDDDGNEMNFYLEIYLEAGKTYYLYIGVFGSGVNSYEVIIGDACTEHIPSGPQACYGYVCSVCEMMYGDTIEHDSNLHEYDASEHYDNCSMCRNNPTNYEYHEYDDNGVCECGRKKLTEGIYIGTNLVASGQYLDNEGNISEVKPEGGYAYYADGVLTLNNFSLVSDKENIFGNRDAIHSEIDLEIIIKGENTIKTLGDDSIYTVNSNLTISGDGILRLITEKIEFGNGYATGDTIDVNFGDLVINGGTLIIYSADNSIEVSGSVEINYGIIYINSGDEGIEAGDVVINGGVFSIITEEYGILSEGDIIINGGDFFINTYDDDGIRSNENITINGGNFDFTTSEECIFADEVLTINGGEFALNSYDSYPAIVGCYDVVFGENMGDQNVIYDDEQCNFVWVDESGNVIYRSDLYPADVDESNVINESWIFGSPDIVYNGEDQSHNIVLKNQKTEEILILGVDYEVVMLTDFSAVPGVYYALVNGIGNYSGSVIVRFSVHECYDITVEESLNINIANVNSSVFSYVKFVPEVTATYRFTFKTTDYLMITLLKGDINSSIDYFDGEDGYICFEYGLVAGETYYFDVYNNYDDVSCDISVELICNEHVGGSATYTDRAVCEICGEEYGDILVCSGHFGGQATYHDRAVCEECGFEYGDILVCDPHVGGNATYHEHAVCENCGVEYGDLLVCNHMCHKGGLYAIIWDIFDKIYDVLGIESECKCGEMH